MARLPTVPAAVAAAIVSAVLASRRRTACAGCRRTVAPVRPGERDRDAHRGEDDRDPGEHRDPPGPAEGVPLLADEHRAGGADEDGAGVARRLRQPVPRRAAGPAGGAGGGGIGTDAVELLEQGRGVVRRPPAVGLQPVEHRDQLGRG